MTNEHVCDTNGNVTMGMDNDGYLVERLRCSECDGVQAEKRVN